LAALRLEAYKRGANAVIYASSRLSEEPTYQELCGALHQYVEVPFYGKGVAVVLQEAQGAEEKK
jgi:hypothetical protein